MYKNGGEFRTLLNAGFGVTWADGKIISSIKATNLINEETQQHIFGDIVKRQVVGEIRFAF